MEERLQKWRLILGRTADPQEQYPLEGNGFRKMDEALEALYDNERQGSLGPTSPNINRWLGDIRRYFPRPVVRILQQDALDRLGLEQLLLERELLETVEADIELVGMLLNLKKLLPEKTKATAREVIGRIVRDIEQRLYPSISESVRGALHRGLRNRRPGFKEIDWHRTIRKNLRHYQKDHGSIIPERLIGFGRRGPELKHIILLVDQSASMATSIVYAGIAGSILASLRSISTHLIVFDTSVVNLTAELHDPVELLFAAQLGGGTDIGNALAYAQSLIQRPTDTTLFLISDLFEGGNADLMIRRVAAIKGSGVRFVSLLALDDRGAPAFDKEAAAALARLDIPVFACTPENFPDLVAAALQGTDLRLWMARKGIIAKN